MEDIIKSITELIGAGMILALRLKVNKENELTLENEGLCDEMLNGLMIKGNTY